MKKPTHKQREGNPQYWLSWDVTVFTALNSGSAKQVMLRKFQVSSLSSTTN